MGDLQGGVEALEQQVLAAHEIYLASLRRAENVERRVRGGIEPFSEMDLKMAERDLGRSRTALSELLSTLGYLPLGMVAKSAATDAGD